MSYPVHITNIYELLGEEGEQPRVLPKAAAPVKPVATGVKTGGGNISGVKPVQSQPARSSRGGERGRGRGGPRPARPIPTGEEDSTRTERREGGWSRQEGSENRGERRGRGASADGFVGNRRVYDRKSGTGRGKEQKKGGSGRGNWGREGEATEANPEEGAEGAETKEVVPVEISAEQAERNAEREQREREEREEQEKEDKLLTLDTYLAQKASSAPKLALPEARKANDGADTKDSKKWANYAVLKKNEDEEKSAEALLEKKKKEKNTVPLNEVFNVRQPRPPRQDRDDREDRGDRGDRERGDRPFRGGRGGRRGGEGQPRGSASTGRGRGGRGGASAPNFEDKSSFPSLAPKA